MSLAVELRPHQVAWLTKHAARGASVWVLIKYLGHGQSCRDRPDQFMLYPGSQAVDLRLEGLKIPPLYVADEDKVDWEHLFGLISPI